MKFSLVLSLGAAVVSAAHQHDAIFTHFTNKLGVNMMAPVEAPAMHQLPRSAAPEPSNHRFLTDKTRSKIDAILDEVGPSYAHSLGE